MDDLIRKQLKRLKKALPKKSASPQPTSSPVVEPDEHALFAEAMRGVIPFVDTHYPRPSRIASPWPRQQKLNEHRSATESMSDLWPWDELETGEELLFSRPGISMETLRKLRRGEWRAQAELDLHGHTSDSARQTLNLFLLECRNRQFKCVRIIHGKGLSSQNREPVLKLKLKNWLAQRSEVLAFCQARPAEGGGGAALVLLKGRREK